MKYFKKLIGDRIYLSPRNAEDAEIFVKWLNDFEVTDYTGRSSILMSLEEEKNYLMTRKNNSMPFVIVKLENDEMIGTVGLEHINQINKSATLGIMIGEKENRGKGYGEEAINLLLDYGFNYLNLNSINLDVLEINERGIACYKKCGFRETGRRRKNVFVNGKYYDMVVMDILKEEFVVKGKSYIRNKNV